MDDLRVSGWRDAINKMAGLDISHVRAAVRWLAALHAATFAYLEQVGRNYNLQFTIALPGPQLLNKAVHLDLSTVPWRSGAGAPRPPAPLLAHGPGAVQIYWY